MNSKNRVITVKWSVNIDYFMVSPATTKNYGY